MTDEAMLKFKESFIKTHSGDNMLSPIMLREGMEVMTYSISPDDAQFLETRKLQIEECARVCRIPQHLINSLDHATFTNIEHRGVEFVTFSLTPWFEVRE